MARRSRRALAESLLVVAEAQDDLHVQAQALAQMARCDRVQTRLRRAHDLSQRAAQLFHRIGDAQGEAMALTTLADSAIALGRAEEAVEVGLLSVELCSELPRSPRRALAHNYLGLAYAWSRSLDSARDALLQAIECTHQCEPAVSPFQPQLNLVYAHAISLATERFHSGMLPGTAAMQAALADSERTAARWGFGGILPGLDIVGRAMFHLLSALSHGWTGRCGAAMRDLRAGRRWAAHSHATTWLQVLQAWVHTELAIARTDWRRAQRWVDTMTRLACAEPASWRSNAM